MSLTGNALSRRQSGVSGNPQSTLISLVATVQGVGAGSSRLQRPETAYLTDSLTLWTQALASLNNEKVGLCGFASFKKLLVAFT